MLCFLLFLFLFSCFSTGVQLSLCSSSCCPAFWKKNRKNNNRQDPTNNVVDSKIMFFVKDERQCSRKRDLKVFVFFCVFCVDRVVDIATQQVFLSSLSKEGSRTPVTSLSFANS